MLWQEAALADLNAYLSPRNEDRASEFEGCQERGVLRKIMGDLQGALKDLNACLQHNSNNYECLKHRADVNRLLNNTTGAEEDRSRAELVQRRQIHGPVCSFSMLPVVELNLP